MGPPGENRRSNFPYPTVVAKRNFISELPNETSYLSCQTKLHIRVAKRNFIYCVL